MSATLLPAVNMMAAACSAFLQLAVSPCASVSAVALHRFMANASSSGETVVEVLGMPASMLSSGRLPQNSNNLRN